MQPRESADWKKQTKCHPLLPGPSFLRRLVNARVKAGLGGKEGAPLPLLLWKWQGGNWHLSLGFWAPCPPCGASGGGEPETGLQERGQGGRNGARGQGGGAMLCYHCPSQGGAECKSASITYKLLPQAAAIEHLLTHFNIDPKEIPTFFFFFS